MHADRAGFGSHTIISICIVVCFLPPCLPGQSLTPGAESELRRAVQSFETGDLPGALAILAPLERAYPASFDIQHLLAITLDLSGKPEEANRHFQKAVALNPNSAAARANLGTSLVRTGKIDAAIAQFKQALKIDPNQATASYNLGTIFLRQRKFSDALPFLQKAHDLQPGVYENGYHLALCLFLLGNHNRAQAVLDSLSPVPKERSEFFLVLALNQAALGRSDSAQATLKEVLPVLAQQPEAHEQICMLLFSQGMFKEAIPILEEAARRFPDSETAAANLAQAQLRTGDFQGARTHAERALALRETAEIHLLLGDILEAAGEPLAAVGHYQKAVELEPSEKNFIALAYEFMSHWNWKEAQDVFSFAAARFTRSWRLRLGLGAACLGQDEYESATRHILEAIALAPGEPLGYQLLAQSFLEASESFDAAAARLRAYHKAHPADPHAAYYRVLADYRSSSRQASPMNYAEGSRLLKTAVARSPDFAAAYFLLGEMSFAGKNWDEAIAGYEQALRLAPDHIEARYKLGLSLQRTGRTERATAELKLFQELKAKQSQAVAERLARTAKFIVERPPQ